MSRDDIMRALRALSEYLAYSGQRPREDLDRLVQQAHAILRRAAREAKP